MACVAPGYRREKHAAPASEAIRIANTTARIRRAMSSLHVAFEGGMKSKRDRRLQPQGGYRPSSHVKRIKNDKRAGRVTGVEQLADDGACFGVALVAREHRLSSQIVSRRRLVD